MTAKRTTTKTKAAGSKKKGSSSTRQTKKKTASKKTAAKPARKSAAKKKPAKTVAKKKPTRKSAAQQAARPKKPSTSAKVKTVRPGRATAAKRVRKKTRPPLDLPRFRQRLLQTREELVQAYNSAKGDSRDRQSDGTEDYIDYAVSSYDREFLLSLTELEQKQLMLVEEALERIKRKKGEYGRCAQCDQEIPAKRLEVQPWARYCLRCQELDEQGLLVDDDSDADSDSDEEGKPSLAAAGLSDDQDWDDELTEPGEELLENDRLSRG